MAISAALASLSILWLWHVLNKLLYCQQVVSVEKQPAWQALRHIICVCRQCNAVEPELVPPVA